MNVLPLQYFSYDNSIVRNDFNLIVINIYKCGIPDFDDVFIEIQPNANT